MALKLKLLSSLAKVFPGKIYGKTEKSMDVFRGTAASFQIAYKGNGKYTYKIKSPIAKYIKVYDVGFVNSDLPLYESCNDGRYQHTQKGLFPDPLFPKKQRVIKAKDTNQALWLEINLPQDVKCGKYDIEIIFSGENESVSITKKINVQKVIIKNREITFTQWFHTDCIASAHKVEIYSEKHWELIKKYMLLATEHGLNTVLVPVLTPPLDTEIGSERPTTQLVDIYIKNGDYVFDFARFHRFVDLAFECGYKNLEINHMFTQWGAKCAPKVMAYENGEYKRIFGWETCASSDEYATFLRALIPALIKEIQARGIENDRVFFHISDEPNDTCIDTYKQASAILKPLVKGYKVIDALSHLEIYNQGLVEVAVCGIDAIDAFIKAGVPELWGYYCCGQTWEVSNRFLSMSSERNRIIGTQIFKYDLDGFLQWGYNFYYSQLSRRKINPYKVTDAGGAFPSGDPFSVYPYKNEAIPSLRLKVFKDALDDVSLLCMLKEKIGKEEAVKLLETVAGKEITFRQYPENEEFFKKLRAAIAKAL